jgi:hypothetical protein
LLAFSVLFFALLKVGEITTENVSFLDEELYLNILSSKADQRQNSITLFFPPQDTDVYPVKLLREYLKVRSPATLSTKAYYTFKN